MHCQTRFTLRMTTATQAQIQYLSDLGMNHTDAAALTTREASAEIDRRTREIQLARVRAQNAARDAKLAAEKAPASAEQVDEYMATLARVLEQDLQPGVLDPTTREEAATLSTRALRASHQGLRSMLGEW